MCKSWHPGRWNLPVNTYKGPSVMLEKPTELVLMWILAAVRVNVMWV